MVQSERETQRSRDSKRHKARQSHSERDSECEKDSEAVRTTVREANNESDGGDSGRVVRVLDGAAWTATGLPLEHTSV